MRPIANWIQRLRSTTWRDLRASPITKVGSAIGIAALLLVVTFTVTSAVHDLDLLQLDGNVADDGTGDDWANVYAGTDNAEVTKFVHDDGADGIDDLDEINYLGGGSKDDLDMPNWEWDTSPVPDKDDIITAGAALYDDPLSDDTILYFFLDRFSAGTGSADVGFWFFKDEHSLVPSAGDPTKGTFSGQHSVGDVLILSEFTIGGSVSFIRVFEWVGDSNGNENSTTEPAPGAGDGPLQLRYEGVDCSLASSGDPACATVNTSLTIDPPWPYTDKQGTQDYGSSALFEGGLNLSELDLDIGCGGTFLANTRASHQTDARLHDFAMGEFAVCSANIQITPDAVNEVGDSHTFDVTVNQVHLGVTSPAADGTAVDVVLTDADGAVSNIITNSCANPGTVNGACTVTFTSNTAGTVTGHASATVSIFGDDFLVETDGVGSNSDDAVKHFVDASVSIEADGVNEVGNEHTFTITVTPDYPAGVSIDSVAITPTGDTGFITAETCDEAGAGTALSCTVTVNSNAAGSASIGADVDVVFSDDSSSDTTTVSRSTDGLGSNSGPAVKHWVDASVSITPDGVNEVGEEHVFTITVTPSYPAGVTLDSVVITPTGDTGFITDTTCDDSTTALSCTVTVDSNAVGSASIGAGVVLQFSDDSSSDTVSVSRSTDGTAPNSDAAVKHWVDASVSITPDGVNEVGEEHVFTITVTPDYPAGVTLDSVVITPTGNTGFITDTTCDDSTTALSCTVTVDSNAAGSASIGADVVLQFSDDSSSDTVSVSRSTDGTAPNSDAAVKHWVDASVSIEADGVNQVGEEHVFTITVTPDYPAGVTLDSVVITPTGDTGFITDTTCDDSTTALSCTVTVDSNAVGSASIGADVVLQFSDDSSSDTVSVSRSTDGLGSNSGPATKTWVDARISIATSGTNQVNSPHTFTVTVEQNDGTGWAPAEGVTVTPSETGVGDITGGTCTTTVTDANGQCTVTVNSSAVGTSTVNASATVTVLGVPIDVATDGYGANTVSNTKTWVDARISIATSGTNQVNSPHTFTVTVEQNDGTGWAPAEGVTVTPSETGVGDITGGTCTTTVTDANGQCTVTVNSSAVGTSTVNASATVTVSGVPIDVATDGYGANTVSNTKTWVDARITIGISGTNGITEPHIFTVTVEQNDGTGWAPAVGVTVTPSETGVGDITDETCTAGTDANGQCTVTVNSNAAGISTVDASATVTVSGVSIDVATDGYGAHTVDNTKTWVDGSLIWYKVDGNGNLLGGATFQVCRTHDRFGTDITDECVTVLDNSAPDADPDNGEFLLDGLPLGTYTVDETIPPAGYIGDPKVETAYLTLESPDAVIADPWVNTQAGRLTHTNVTCQDYLSGSPTIDISTISYNVKQGKINNTAPGVFFYYTQVTAPSDDPFVVNIVQENDKAGFPLFNIQNNDQVRLFNGDCSTATVDWSFTASGGLADVTIDANAGDTFIISVKYITSNVVGQPNPGTVHYDFSTWLDGVQVDSDPNGLDLKKK